MISKYRDRGGGRLKERDFVSMLRVVDKIDDLVGVILNVVELFVSFRFEKGEPVPASGFRPDILSPKTDNSVDSTKKPDAVPKDGVAYSSGCTENVQLVLYG